MTPFMKRSFALAFVFFAVCLALVLTSGASPIAAQATGASTPDVYVAASNSFVITVPNLTKVAVGNPSAVLANVISTTEVLVQGSASVTNQGDGLVNFATSNVYVWSGEKRYVYRVIVIETADTSLPYGVTRMVVEPNKVLVYGRTADLSRTERGVRDLFESLSVKYELHLTEVSLTEAMQEYVNVDRSRVEDAISRGEVIQGMTLDDLRRSQGGTLPPIYESTTSENRIYDYYLLPNYRVGVTGGVVAVAERRSRVPETVRQAALSAGIVLEDMTETDITVALGPPPQPPTVISEGQNLIREYVYPTLRVQVMDGRVTSVTTIHPVVPSNVVLEPVNLGTFRLPNGALLMGRAYRLQYVSGADVRAEVERLATTWNTARPYSIGYSVDGLFAVFADSTTVGVIDNMITILDRPMVKAPISIQQTEYVIPAGRSWDAQFGAWQDIPARQVGFLIARFNSTITTERREQIANELQRSIATLPVIPFAQPLSLNLDGATMTITGVPEQVNILRNILEGMVPDLVGRDITSAVADGRLLSGMTRQQVETARNVTIGSEGRQVTTADGNLAWMHDLGDRAVVLSEDVLVDEIMYPGPDQVRNALAKKHLVPMMLRSDVEKVLGETARQITRQPDGTELVTYNFGEASYWRNRLETLNGVSGSEIQRLGISVRVPDAEDLEFQQLTSEEQQIMMTRGIVMRGMTERDVARTLASSPFNIRPGSSPSEKVYTYGDYEVVFRDGIARRVTSTGSGSPRIIALKSRRASEILNLIVTTFPTSDEVTINSDSISNRLIVRAPDDRFLEIERFAKAMDQQEIPQVLIEAKFVEVNRNIVRQLGVQWGLSGQSDAGNQPFAGFGSSNSRTDANNQPSGNVRTGSVAGGNQTIPVSSGTADGGLLLGMLGGSGFSLGGLRYTNVDVMIAALESAGDAEVLSSPRIVTLNNQEALIKSVTTVQDIIITVERNELGQPISTTTEFQNPVGTINGEVGVQLTVTPNIGADGIITMRLEPYVTRVDNVVTTGDGSQYNQIGIRQSTSSVMVRSGTPLVIGGLSSRNKVSNQEKIPFLGSIPIIGHLFRSERKLGQDIELLIFLTARIVPPDGTVSSIDRALMQPRSMIPNPAPTTTLPAGATSSAAR
jgi:Flp pilus assembly secretin CpaC